MSQKEQKMKKVMIVFLAMAFCISVFLIIAGKYKLWDIWFPNEPKIQELELLSENAQWKHLKSENEPGVGNVWTTMEYSTEGWETVTGEYVEDAKERGITTAFFRYEFDLEDAGKYEYMEANIQYADAVIVYLNGEIVFAGNVPEGGYYSNLDMGACNDVDTKRESTFVITDLEALISGKNVIAVEVHRKDEASQDINFHFQRLVITEAEYEEDIPDTEGLLLRKGKVSDEVEMEWISELPDSYKIEYMEGTLDTVKLSTFSAYAQTAIMGNTELSDGVNYLKTGKIKRLKERTDYVYRVTRIGGVEGSKLYQFRTEEKQKYSYLYTGIVSVDSMTDPVDLRKWQERLEGALKLAGRTDYLIAGKVLGEQGEHAAQNDLANERLFRSATQLKEVPVIVSEIDMQQNKVDSGSRQKSWAHMDLLMFNLNTNDKDYEGVRQYIKNMMAIRNRKWNMVILSAPEAVEQHAIDENYMAIFRELDIDLVLVNGSKDYSGILIGEDSEMLSGEKYVKRQGETMYIYGGEMAATLHVSTKEVEIKTYNIESQEQMDEMHLLKSS